MLKQTRFFSLVLILSAAAGSHCFSAEDPKNLANEFTKLAEAVANLKGEATFADFQKRQGRAALFYRSFLQEHPDSVYSNKVRWALYSAYLTLERKEEAGQVLEKIQESVLKELLRISYAQKNLGEAAAGGQILEGVLEKSDSGAVRAIVAQFLWYTGERKRALKLLNEVIRDTENKYPPREEAQALLVKAGCYYGTEVANGLLQELVDTYPTTEAGREGAVKLRAALLKPGSDAVPFSVTTVDGEPLSLQTLKGKPVLLYFWATYSYASWKDLGKLKAKLGTAADGPVTVVAVACESYIDRPKTFLRGQGVSWRLVAEGNKWNSTLAKLYDVKTLPYFVLINAEGKIVTAGQPDAETLLKKL